MTRLVRLPPWYDGFCPSCGVAIDLRTAMPRRRRWWPWGRMGS